MSREEALAREVVRSGLLTAANIQAVIEERVAEIRREDRQRVEMLLKNFQGNVAFGEAGPEDFGMWVRELIVKIWSGD